MAQAAENTPPSTTKSYLNFLEKNNAISYQKVLNTQGAYIPSMCYTKTLDENDEIVNPCYSCHTTGKIPNYRNDTHLQQELLFPTEMLVNPYSNLFQDHSEEIAKISDEDILTYLRKSNYKHNQTILLQQSLPKDWPGYRPDSYFNFDKDGFDRTPNGGYTLWRAFRYYPFLGTFWPTNGSTDDVLIRLDSAFSKTVSGQFDPSIYRLNLAIVESLIKQKSITLEMAVDEKRFAVDLNQNGKLDFSKKITFPAQTYLGLAGVLLKQGKFHLAAGLYPENTEFLHTVRYLDWNEKHNKVLLSARLKELRYSKKYRWMTYSQLDSSSNREFWEALTADNDEPQLQFFRGQPSSGLKTNNGWILQGFIEDKIGQLRPQSKEETLFCMGCHSGIGATTDATFAMPRKLENIENDFGWQHWSQAGLEKIPDQIVNYKNHSNQFEYSFYLNNNHSANELGSNDEVKKKFFNPDGSAKKNIFALLRNDISILLLPTKKRALELNKAYRVTVKNQSYIYGREGNSKPLKNLHKKVKPNQKTDIESIISK